ncbi:hypothetical protein R3P38DRAFT_3171559 [Favolaschia claudopus]|uniref:Uncharacterized protein n=1 Tax=Favolaschia claudopus TaxID=2862362 RepID=A0AAW0DNN6_9AGAR
MSAANSTGDPAKSKDKTPGNASITAPFTFSKKTIPVTIPFVEQGLQQLSKDQVGSVSAPLPAQDIRKEGGIPSSAAFAAEQAKDAERYAALNPETRDQSISLSSQMKRDFLLANASPPAPPDFAVGPSLATRPVSRTASMAGETVDSPTPDATDDAGVTPVILPNHKEVSSILHLAVPPTTKAGQKEKTETAGVAAARANGNITRIGGKLIAVEARVDLLDRKFQNFGHSNISNDRSLEQVHEEVASLKGDVRSGLENTSFLHSQLARISESFETLKHELVIVKSTISSSAGNTFDNDAFASRTEVSGLHAAVQEGFDGVEGMIDERLASALGGLETVIATIAKVEGRQSKLEQDLLAVRENVARTQLELGALTMGSKAPTASLYAPAPAVVAAPVMAPSVPQPTTAAPVAFTVGGKKLKRKPSVELVAGPTKRANNRPDKSGYQYWVRVSPVNPDTKVPAPGLFKKLVDAAAIAGYTLPPVYIERATGEPSTLNIGFTVANDANTFVGAWAGGINQMPLGLRVISAQHMRVAGSSSASDIAFLTGN